MDRFSKNLLRVLASSALATGVASAQSLPAMKFQQAPLVTPANAITYYGASTTRTYSLKSVQDNATAGIRPAEIVELAKGLGSAQVPGSLSQSDYAQRVFEYVRQNIEITFMYGLQKGAVGALINQSGTAFDQAQLMVELLRAAGITGVQYEAGTVTMNGATFTAWSGLSDAGAACRLLADGGIPASVNGSTDVNCGISGAISTVQLRHIWVSALGNKYDAAYKVHTFKNAIDLPAALGCGTAASPTCGADVRSALTLGSTTGTSSGVSYYQMLSATGHTNKMNSLAGALQTYLTTNLPNALIEDVIGGSAIDFESLPTPGPTLAYTTANTALWTDIPDQYRVKLRVVFDNINMNTTNPAVAHNVFFADEIYGKRVYLLGALTDFVAGTPPSVPHTATRRVSLYVDHELVAVSTRTGGTVNNTLLTLDVNHPYAANSGAYMDEQITQLTQSQQDNLAVTTQRPQGGIVFYPTTIVSEWGATGAGLATYSSAMERRDNYIWNVSDPYSLTHQWDCTSVQNSYIETMGSTVQFPGVGQFWPSSATFQQPFLRHGCLQPQQRTHLGNWLTQNGRMLELVGQVNSSKVLTHHIVGSMISGFEKPGQINVSSTLSVVSATNSAADRQAVSVSLAALSSHLEASVFQQGVDNWEANSTSSMLVRSNEKGQQLLLATPSSITSTTGQLLNYPSAVITSLQSYTTGGSSVIVPKDWIAGTFYVPPAGSFPAGSIPINYNGYLAFKPAGDFIAHLVGVGGSKGATVGSNSDINPAKAVQDSVKQMDASLKSRKTYGVSTASGTLTLSPAPDLVTGTGSFPNSLAFQRVYDSTSDPLSHSATTVGGSSGASDGMPTIGHETLPDNPDQWLPGGWDFTLHIRATLGSNSLQAMGEDSALDAAATISALYVLRDLNRTITTTPDQAFLPQLTTAFTTYWWGKTLINNSVVVRRPPASATFMRLPNGNFNPPPNSAERLVQTNDRILVTDVMQEAVNAPISHDKLSYSYASVQFTLTDGQGAVLNFGWQGTQWSLYATSRTFDLGSWVFPDGVRIDYDYGIVPNCNQYLNGPYMMPPKRLTAIRNNLGRSLNFPSLSGYANNAGYSCNGVTAAPQINDGSGRKVTFTTTVGPLTNVPGFPRPGFNAAVQRMGVLEQVSFSTLDSNENTVAATRYVYKSTVSDLNAPRPGLLIESWYTLTDSYPSSPLAHVQYDSLLRVNSTDSAPNNAANQRSYTDYRIGGLGFSELVHRGESLDPVNALTTTYFDKFGQPLAEINALGHTTLKVYDSRQRLRRVIAPEGNSTEYTYDVRSNPLTVTQRPKPGSAWANTVTTTTYPEGSSIYPCANPALCNKPATQTDEKGRVTNYEYYPNGQLQQVKRPAVGGNRPERNYCYNNHAFGSYPTAGGTISGYISLLSGSIEVVGGGKPNRVSRFAYENAYYNLSSVTVDPTDSRTTACGAENRPSAKNLITAFTFDGIGNVASINGPRTDVTDVSTYTFDTLRRLKQVDGPTGTDAKTVYTYFDDGTLRYTDKQEIVGGSPVLRREERTYWPSGDLKTVKDPQNNITQTYYDLAGRVNLITDPDGRRVGTVYNGLGQTLCSWKGWNTSNAPINCTWSSSAYATAGYVGPLRYAAYTYTPNGKQATVQDGNGNQTDYVYDKFDRLRYTLFPSPTSGERCTGPTGENTSQGPTCSGLAANATYEELRYSTSGNPAANGAALCSSNNQVCTKRTRKNDTLTWTYDDLNRVSTKAATGLPTVTTTYNLLGEVLSVSNPVSGAIVAANTTYDYDDLGRKLYEENLLGGTNRRVSYEYDQASNRSRTTWPDSYYVSYQYDALNRMQTVRENSTTTNELALYSYDSLSRRTGLRFAGQANHRVAYTYEPDSNLDVLSHYLNNASPSVTLDQGYNGAGRITSIAANDNFYLPAPTATVTTAYVPDKLNRYSAVGGTSPTYDNNSNLLTWTPVGGTHTYRYDSENRLRGAAVGGSGTETIVYQYDSLGRRISKSVSSTVTHYLLDGDEEIAELNSSGVVQRRYLMGPAVDDRIATAEGSATSSPTKTYFHTNHQGSVIGMADTAGNVTGCAGGVNCQRLSYDEYGRLGVGSVTTGQPYRYTGRRFDAETGLYYYRARYYSPELGRFLQTDPIGYEDDLNLYSYVGNDPVNATDPTGQNGAAAAAVVVGGALLCARSPACVRIVGSIVSAAAGALIGNYIKDSNEESPASPSPSETPNNQPSDDNGDGNGQPPPPPASKWKVGDDPNMATRTGNDPSRQTVTRREWKNEAAKPTRSDFTKQDLQRMEKGRPPQRVNPRNPRNGGVESMERSHEPVPKRDGGTKTVPKWPEEHEAVDPCRVTGYC